MRGPEMRRTLHGAPLDRQPYLSRKPNWTPGPCLIISLPSSCSFRMLLREQALAEIDSSSDMRARPVLKRHRPRVPNQGTLNSHGSTNKPTSEHHSPMLTFTDQPAAVEH